LVSLEAPHYPLSEQARGRLGQAFRRYTLPRLYEQRYRHPYILSRINAFRASLGLAAIRSLRLCDRLITHQICLFPEWYCPRASDWPQSIDCVGFPLSAPRGALPVSVLRWMERWGLPIVFTPGTGVVEVQPFFEAARRCCQLLERPGLFLSPNFDASQLEPAGPIAHHDYLDLTLVLRHAALLVHHGGIGTTAQALAAGIPQIISPQAFDQPDNGDRVSRLGAGRMIARPKLTGETLAAAASQLLCSAQVRRVLADLSSRARAANAIPSAADILERRFVR
jgi:rhamnosyltransferase subunit B